MPAQVLGSQHASSSNQCVITLTDDVPADGCLQCCFVYDDANTGFDPDTGTTDSGSHTWTVFTTTRALVGHAAENSSLPAFMIEAGSCARVCVAGDLAASDTMTLHFNGVMAEILAVLLYVPLDFSVNAIQQTDAGFGPGVSYGNSNMYPTNAPPATATDLRYVTAGFNLVQPDDPALCLAIAAARPGETGFTWADLSGVHEEIGGNMSIHIGMLGGLAADEQIDPGGQWPTGRTLSVVNYQFAVEIFTPEARFNHTFYAEDDLGIDRTEQYPVFNHTFKADA